MVDAGNFKGSQELGRLEQHTQSQAERYVEFMRREGYYAEAVTAITTDVVAKIAELTPQIVAKYPNAVFFGGQLVFARETAFTRLLHNAVVFSAQRILYAQGHVFLIIPIRV